MSRFKNRFLLWKARCILLLSDKMNVEYVLLGLVVYEFNVVSLMVGF